MWINEYNKETEQLQKMNTWDESKLYDKNKIINSMLIFDTKRNNSKKCRLVAKINLQKPETYDSKAVANTVHHLALNICLAMALDKN